jgi:catechol 2,3-dioxygenase-like lactoylglutathione lyase family enzyme
MSADTRVRFHLSLNVSDLGRAVAFYRTLLGVEPAKLRTDYAKFEPDDPPLVLSLEPTPRPVGGPLNHLGFRLPDAKSLVAVQERLERAGLRTNREEGVECCYAKQTKFWATDPDGTLWEVYTFDGDLDHRGAGQSLDVMAPPDRVAAARPVTWEHRMSDPVPERIPLADGTADEVSLRGTFNLPLGEADGRRVIAEAARVLRPGGRIFLHTLVAERAREGDTGLPGPAAAVRHTPLEGELPRLLETAGFTAVRLVKFDGKPCFVRDGVGMREQQLEAFKPVPATGDGVEVLYKGPFASVADESGCEFSRGVRVRVSPAVADRLRQPGLAYQFVVFEAPSPVPADCGTERA